MGLTFVISTAPSVTTLSSAETFTISPIRMPSSKLFTLHSRATGSSSINGASKTHSLLRGIRPFQIYPALFFPIQYQHNHRELPGLLFPPLSSVPVLYPLTSVAIEYCLALKPVSVCFFPLFVHLRCIKVI